jgi:hypothetical protein
MQDMSSAEFRREICGLLLAYAALGVSIRHFCDLTGISYNALQARRLDHPELDAAIKAAIAVREKVDERGGPRQKFVPTDEAMRKNADRLADREYRAGLVSQHRSGLHGKAWRKFLEERRAYHREKCATAPRPSRFRPKPDDFRDRYVEHGWGWIMDHYEAGRETVMRWIDEEGRDELYAARREYLWKRGFGGIIRSDGPRLEDIPAEQWRNRGDAPPPRSR